MTCTEKQEKFAQAYIENGGNKSAAYRSSYNAEKMADETIWVEACKLFKNPKVAIRVLELQEEHRERHNVTVDSITKELDESRDMAKDLEKPEAMTTATMGKAKLHGLISDKKEIGGIGGNPIEHNYTVEVVDATPKDS